MSPVAPTVFPALDATYRAQRLKIQQAVLTGSLQIWDSSYQERDRAIAAITQLVQNGQEQTAALVDAYMASAMQAQGAPGRVRGIDRKAYSIEQLRNLPAAEVYSRPFGALAAQIEKGNDFAVAMASARAMVAKLAATDLQLSQTHAARDWMTSSQHVAGYRRALGAGRNCGLCVAASTQRYWKADLMAIHENCHCGVQPIAGTEPIARSIDPETWKLVADQAKGDLSPQALSRLKFDNASLPDVLVIKPDPELGMRLLDQKWRTGEGAVVDGGGKRASR